MTAVAGTRNSSRAAGIAAAAPVLAIAGMSRIEGPGPLLVGLIFHGPTGEFVRRCSDSSIGEYTTFAPPDPHATARGIRSARFTFSRYGPMPHHAQDHSAFAVQTQRNGDRTAGTRPGASGGPISRGTDFGRRFDRQDGREGSRGN